MIRFSAVLVVIAVAVLIGGVATSTLLLVYVAIILSAAALIALAIGVARKRDELFGGPGQRPVGDVMGSAAGQPYLSGQSGGYAAGGQGYTGQSYPGQGYTGQSYSGTVANARVTSAPGRSAPLPSSRSVTETRADLQALPDTPRPGNPADADATRTDLPPVRPDSQPPSGGPLPSRLTGSRPAGADETRLDLSPVLDDKDLNDKVVPSRPLTGGAASGGETSGGGASRAPETRYDLPALGENRGSGAASGLTSGLTSGPASSAPETRSDLPAQPDTQGQHGTSSAPESKPLTDGNQVAIIPGVPRYHAPGCILIRFMDSEDLEMKTLDEAKAAGCTPCTACQSD